MRPMLNILEDLNKSMNGLSDKRRMLKFDKLGLDLMGTLGFSTLKQQMDAAKKAAIGQKIDFKSPK